MTTVDVGEQADTVDTPPDPLRTRLVRAGGNARRRTALFVRTNWRRARWLGRGFRGAAGFVLVRIVWPALVRPFQSTKWGTRWHEITNDAVQAKLQVSAVAWVLGWTYLLFPSPYLLWTLLPALPALAFGAGRLAYPHTSRGLSRGRFHPDAFATWPELRRAVSAHAVRKRGAETRPALARAATPPGATSPSAWMLARMPATRFGTWVGNTACGPPFPVRTYTSHENGILLIGPPRTIKTSTMTHQVADFPGAVLSLQTKASTYHDTWVIRERVGPVYLIDPECITGDKSTFRWAPQRGCADPQVAAERAAAFAVAATKLGEDGPWLSSQTIILLRAFLLIADVARRPMTQVYEWTTSVEAAQGAVDLMDRHAERVPARWIKAAEGVLSNKAHRTIGAVFLALHEAVGFMGDERAAELCSPAEDEPSFDVATFLKDRGTVYLVASDREENKVGPLLSAFASFVVEEAKRIAGPRERERLEPGLHVSGDEAANTIPLDLPRLFADSGGRGIQVCASVQSRSQLRQRYGRDGADTVWNSATTKLFAGGSTVDDDLISISKHSGTRTEWHGGKPQQVPGLSFDEARRIPDRHAALLTGDMRMTLVHLPPPWRRPDVIAGRLQARTRRAAGALRAVVAGLSSAPALPAGSEDR